MAWKHLFIHNLTNKYTQVQIIDNNMVNVVQPCRTIVFVLYKKLINYIQSKLDAKARSRECLFEEENMCYIYSL